MKEFIKRYNIGWFIAVCFIYMVFVAGFSVYVYFDAYNRNLEIVKNDSLHVFKIINSVFPDDSYSEIGKNGDDGKIFVKDVYERISHLVKDKGDVKFFFITKDEESNSYYRTMPCGIKNQTCFISHEGKFLKFEYKNTEEGIKELFKDKQESFYFSMNESAKGVECLGCSKRLSEKGFSYAVCTIFSRNELKEDMDGIATREFIKFSTMFLLMFAFIFAFKQTLSYREEKFKKEIIEKTEDLTLALGKAKMVAKARSDFIASISHELRTPLNAILGFSEAMSSELFGPISNDKYKEYINHIHTSSEYILKITNDVLDLAKFEANKTSVFETSINIKLLFKTVENMIRGYLDADKRNIIVQNVSENFPRLYADEKLITQILLNILSNAVKFTQEGGRIELKVSINEKNGKLSFYVKDNGVGISKESQKKIFNAFEQDEKQDLFLKKHIGTGLGLSLVRSYVKLFDGEIALTSNLNEGSEFIISFPCSRVKFHG